MKSIRLTLHVTILLTLAVLVGSAPTLAATSQTFFVLTGIEVSPGTTTLNAPSAGMYTTTGIRFVGIANGEPRNKWTVSLNIQGPLENGAPEVCNSNQHIITGGTWGLQAPGGVVGGQITGGALAFRPDGPGGTPTCAGPVPLLNVTLNVSFATGLYRFVTAATVGSAVLDHSSFPPHVGAVLTLTSP